MHTSLCGRCVVVAGSGATVTVQTIDRGAGTIAPEEPMLHQFLWE